MVLVLVVPFVALWFMLRGNLYYFLLCVILFLCFSVLLALRLPRLGKRERILVLFVHLFDLCLFGFCLFPLPLGVWEGLRFVIVALPELFSYPFFPYITYEPLSDETYLLICLSNDFANSVDPDQTAPQEQSDQGPHCLPICKLKSECASTKPR